MIVSILGFVLTYIVFSNIILLIFLSLGIDEHVSPSSLLLVSQGLGPALVAWIYYFLLLILPNQPGWFYPACNISIFLIGFVLSRRQIPRLFQLYKDFAGLVKVMWHSLGNLERGLVYISGLLLIMICFVGVSFPIVENDALSFAVQARIIHRDRSLDSYLNVSTPDIQTGYYYPAFQPPFLQTLYVWFFDICGSSEIDYLVRSVAPYYALGCIILLGWIVYQRADARSAVWACFLCLATPIFFRQSYGNSQDPSRLYLSLLSIAWFASLLRNDESELKWVPLLTGIVSGLALFSHILALPFIISSLIAYMFFRKVTFRRKARELAAIALGILIVPGLYHYMVSNEARTTILHTVSLENILSSSNAEPDSTSSSAEPDSTSDSTEPKPTSDRLYYLYLRGQFTKFQQLVYGRLQMFTGIEHFGFLFYAGLYAIVWWLLKEKKQVMDVLFLFSFICVAGIVLSGFRQISWANPRYLGTLVIVVPYFSGPAIAATHEKMQKQGFWRLIFGAGTATLIIPLLITTTILGTKVGITNNGEFYSQFRTFHWLSDLVDDPTESITTFWNRYSGIRKTLIYAFDSDREKLVHSHDSLATIIYFSETAPSSERALVWRPNHYFYYSNNPGMVWYDPRLSGMLGSANEDELLSLLKNNDISYIIIDETHLRSPGVSDSVLPELLADSNHVSLDYEFGTSYVYELR